MRRALWSVVLIAAVVVGTTVLFSAGRNTGSDRSPSSRRTAVPLPSATAVTGGTAGADPVQAIPDRPTRIRVELYGTATTADISFSVRTSGVKSTPAELDDHPLPWAAELDVPRDADYLSVTGFSYDRDTEHQILCRIIVGGVVVVTEQQAEYASCYFSLDDVGG